MIEPKVGIKFMIKAIKPQTIGKSRCMIAVPIPTRIPVASEIKNFIERKRTVSVTIC